ncbi:30S ribosomal protein S4e [Pyrobaculum calidifontis]|uniref:Small ribosomal subunit protein eS4 n=1 Tax=Pyrobaculum calidifontis (strain DSM 21063 / JCM 11548 / VA1) TaxID=410359 RepID=RS4E_PYRCJ|nr:30S ribosomal protein S4e [Pyrobaculum calidifontis]A3MWZ7.1 RecName: Full=Small ribosomal subunit protein eS4; AltName: Full=30S ribosomal protein S4e [Pyrobaculum calidifontis JCM 11548]ABO09164.1 SSU ribosomal protein S4E [Pyrobaculum calidifontis JCM 11548]
MVHLRKSLAPYWWPIPRKAGGVWAVRPSTGPHSLEYSLPLAVVVRDVLRYAKTLREARYIISRGYIKVDGVVRKDYKFPIGLMDVVEIVPTGEIYRVVPDEAKYYDLKPIPSSEAALKPLRVEGKTAVSGGRIQLHFHDGRNLILPPDVGRQIKTFDTVVYDLENKAIKTHLPLRLGQLAVVTHGGNIGFVGQFFEVVWTLKRRQSVVALRKGEEVRRTILDYIMVIGTEAPVVKIS